MLKSGFIDIDFNIMYNDNHKICKQMGDIMKNILLCCNKMGIGGVETVILNQITAFTRKGYNVYVVAEKGLYSDKVEELGGKFIEVEFPEENDINKERVNKLINIIKEKQITEIHIHKYQCIPSVLVAAYITGIPYFAYEHGIKDTKKYYTWKYPLYKAMFPIYFNNAYKIIAITPKVAEMTKNEYHLKEEKYVIVHNGIDFNIYKNNSPNYNDSINKVLIVSRIDEEKLTTIYNGIDVFKQLLKINPNAQLYIVGGGNEEDKVIKYLDEAGLKYTYKDEETTVKLLGNQTDVSKYLKETDIFLGVDRCALEAIAMKVPVIITGYDGIKGLLTTQNMNVAMEENFSGFNMSTITSEECLKDILFLKENKRKIVDKVYEVARENLDCYNNYITMPENQTINFDWFQLFDILKEYTDLVEKQDIDIKAKYEWIQKIEKENKELWRENEKLQENINKNEEKISDFKKDLNKIYNSKRWRYAEKINNFFNKRSENKIEKR